MNGRLIVNLLDRSLPETIGNKARNLRRLSDKGFRIPVSYACTWEAYQAFGRQDPQRLPRLRSELGAVLKAGQAYAVRSSANIEDSLDYSFAGQFKTVLDVSGVDAVLEALQEIWQAAHSEVVESYLAKVGRPAESLQMGALIQEMVPARLSGVAFSKNPITALDEVIVEAVQGSGIALVQGGVTPLRWVNKWGKWLEKPEPETEYEGLVGQIVTETNQIARKFKTEVDLEWVFDGQQLYWVQLREITALRAGNIYSNRMAKEMTPGMVKPLVWSVTTPIPSQVWIDIISEAVGATSLTPDDLMKAFHYRAYHNMGAFGQVFEKLGMPRESLEMMAGMAPPGTGMPFKPGPRFLLLVPRLARFLWAMWNLGRQLDEAYPRLVAQKERFILNPRGQSPQWLAAQIDEINGLYREATRYTIPAILLMQIYSGMLRSRLKKLGVAYEQFHLTEGMDELRRFDPNETLQALHTQFTGLPVEAQDQIRQAGRLEGFGIPQAQDFERDLAGFMKTFGHLSDATGHFGNPPWRETPGLVLELIAGFEKAAEGDSKKVHLADLPEKARRQGIFQAFYQRARQYRLYREKFSLLHSYTLMLFRDYYLAIADHLVQAGRLLDRQDIYYLYDGEVRAWVAGQRDGTDFARLVDERRKEMELAKDAVLPDVIFGDAAPPVIPASRDRLRGVATSKGYYTGPVKVIHGVSDFSKLEHGDVLVIPYSDVSWAPLFARAGALVAESGGMLSHSSIVAREYNIPAVVSVAGALGLSDQTLVTIDGYKGLVLIHDSQPVSG
jgi:pyruvate,water dikinase